MARKKIAVLGAQFEENYQEQFISGFLENAFKQDYDVFIFSMYQKYQDSGGREIGESNIYNLVPYDQMDAIVILLDTIQTPGVAEKLEDEIHKTFKGPVLCIDKESKYFPMIMTDHYTPVKELISHLIEEHGYEDIAYLTGKEWHIHSKQRLQAYIDCMEEHGLPVREDRIFYGDFWYTSGENMVERIMKEPKNLPRAIACANDCMAIGVAKSLTENGIRVPQDVAVVGYDSIEEGRLSPEPLTSAPIPAKECGRHTAISIAALLNGEEMEEFHSESQLYIGSSCGCKHLIQETQSPLRVQWDTDISSVSFYSCYNHMMDDILCQMSLEDLIPTIFSYVHQIRPFHDFYLCLNEAWNHSEKMALDRKKSDQFSDEMLAVLQCKSYGECQNQIDFERVFDRKQLIPDYDENRGEPKAFFFTPLYFEERSFGYSVISFGNEARSYNDTYQLWIRNVMFGLECYRRVDVLQYTNQMLKSSQIRDSLTGLYNYTGFLQQTDTFLKGCSKLVGVIAVDVKGLTSINDGLGRETGNQVIIRLAKILENVFPEGTGCCLGNGELFVAIPYEDGDEQRVVKDKVRFLESLEKESELNDEQLKINVYLGESCEVVSDKQSLEDLIGNAISRKNGNKVSEQKLNQRGDLTAEEKVEAQMVRQLLDENRFQYHFQPIVSAKTGNIYAYEALMRADVIPYLSPVKVLKYAEYFERLYDVEKATFFNVLQRIEESEDVYEGKKVFINSIPGNRLTGEDEIKLEAILKKHSDMVVVELTEQTELSDEALAEMKASYSRLGIETAVDDYGTGYSNVTNLLRYMPNYVKIDRMLLSDIQDSPQKQHFVKDIIAFAHDNNIMALAEGVETTEELQTVIKLGVDLIQGYYTAKPTLEVIDSIASSIQEEIIKYNKQLHERFANKIFTAGKEYRVFLNRLMSEKYKTLEVVKDKTIFRDFAIIGIPGIQTDIDLIIRDGYQGRIELENTSFLTKDGKICISIGQECDIIFVLRGENNITKYELDIPSNSSITFEQ